MSDLFIHTYLDEDVSVVVAALIRARAFGATTTVEAGNRGRSDAEQLAFAAGQGWCLLTHNRADFEVLAREYLAAGRHHAGIVVAVRRTPAEIARRLLAILNDVTANEMVDQLRYI